MSISLHDDLSLRYVLSVPTAGPDDSPIPLVIVMHGRGADAKDLAGIAPAIDAGCRFVFPNAPRALETFPGMASGYTWFDGWPPAGDSVLESRNLLLRFVDELVSRYATPEGKLIISGFSQGAMMALDTGFRTRQKVAGIVSMSGALYENDMADLRSHDGIPVLIVHGTEDDMIPVIAARRMRRVLEENGIEPEYHEFPMGHWVTPESLAVVRAFLQAHLTIPAAGV